jgi:hypothetical protein
LKKDEKFNTPGHAEDLAEMQKAMNDSKDFMGYPSFGAYVVHKFRIFSSFVAISSTTFFILVIGYALTASQDYNPIWMLYIPDITNKGGVAGLI